VFLYSGVYPTNSRCVSHQSQCIPLSTTFCNLSTLLETKLQQFNKHVLYLLSSSIHVYLKFQLNKIEYLHHRCGFQIWGTHQDGGHTGKKRYESGFLNIKCLFNLTTTTDRDCDNLSEILQQGCKNIWFGVVTITQKCAFYQGKR
jgi:hypothetical protein